MSLTSAQIAQTLARVVPTGWSVRGTHVTFENRADALTDREIEDAFNAYQYIENRVGEYPPLTELADALYWSSKGSNTKLDEYYAACEAVKAKYPKPEGS